MGVQWFAYRTNPGTEERKRCGEWAKGYLFPGSNLKGVKTTLRVRANNRKYHTRTIEVERLEPYDPVKHGRKE